MRNDTVNKLVYWYDSINTHQELILYDFNISVGDTINPNTAIFGNNPNDTIIVVSTDSIDIGGSYRKSYAIASIGPTTFNDTIIEGIGSQRSLFYRCYGDTYCYGYLTDQSNLICYQYKNYQYSPNHGFDCSFQIGFEEINAVSNDIVQRAGENLYYISNSENHSINIDCFDMSGKFMFEKSFNDSGYLDFSLVPSGIYFMQIVYNGHPIHPYKLIVQH